MRKLILQEFVTLDGLAAGPNDGVDFVPHATEGDRSFGLEPLRLIDAIDTILLGRVTYRMFSEYRPKVTDGEQKAFADKLNATPKIVFSKKARGREAETGSRQRYRHMGQPLSRPIADERGDDRRISAGDLSSRSRGRKASLSRQGR